MILVSGNQKHIQCPVFPLELRKKCEEKQQKTERTRTASVAEVDVDGASVARPAQVVVAGRGAPTVAAVAGRAAAEATPPAAVKGQSCRHQTKPQSVVTIRAKIKKNKTKQNKQGKRIDGRREIESAGNSLSDKKAEVTNDQNR